jgi:uridine phosphorylase
MSNHTNSEFPQDGEGRTIHVGVKAGEVAQRVLSVGSAQRAELISQMLDSVDVTVTSGRGFVTYTGMYKGKRVSIIATQMGVPNMDFVVREARAMADGPMAIVRFGTCGALTDASRFRIGQVCVTERCCFVEPDFGLPSDNADDLIGKYRISAMVEADRQLTSCLKQCLPEGKYVTGDSASGLDFYGCQGRTERDFDDRNSKVVEDLMATYPNCVALEMEHFMLLRLARLSKPGRKIAAACCAIGLSQRPTHEMLRHAEEKEMEKIGGRAALDALVAYEFE